MNEIDDQLVHSIKMKFGTHPLEPNQKQLVCIKEDVNTLIENGIEPTIVDLADIVKKHCPKTGKYFYKGIDNSDLITLLKLAVEKE